MEILNDNDALLSNNEVLNLLKESKKMQDRKKEHKNLATIRYETVKYLEDTPCKHQDDRIIQDFLMAIKTKGYRLTKAEKLEIVNQRPSTLVELQLVIEESEERFSEDAMNEILDLVQQALPPQEPIEEEMVVEGAQSGEEHS